MGRRLTSWLDAYLDWTLPRSEAPKTLILWAGLYTIASVAKRNIRFPRSLLGSYDIYPNLYVIFVGPPGVIRKSTTAGYAEDLLVELKANSLGEPLVHMAPEAISSSDLLRVLSETPAGSLSIISSEFGTFMGTSEEKMYDLLTDIYDGKRKFEYSTRAHGQELTQKPCVNLLAATTPSWIATAPEYAIGGGFGRRTIFIFENQVRQRRLYYTDVDYSSMESLKKDLQWDLMEMAKVRGDFRHDSRATMEAMEEWYRANADPTEGRDERVEGYFQTKHVHVHKLAMLLSLAEGPTRRITMPHFNRALKILEDVEEKMPQALAPLGRNPFSSIMFSVMEFIESLTPVPVHKRKILARYYHQLSEPELDSILSALVAMDRLQLIRGDKGPKDKLYKLKG